MKLEPAQLTHTPLPRATRAHEIGESGKYVVDFWEWAYGSLGTNATRGVFAEYLVGLLLDATGERRDPWASHDLTYGAARIEVKSAAYLQDWTQKEPSRITFSVGARYPEAGTDPERWTREHRCDIYVLCLEVEKDPTKFDPLVLSQWRFYVVPVGAIRERGRASVTLGWLETNGYGPLVASDLRAAVDVAVALGKARGQLVDLKDVAPIGGSR